MMRKGIGNKPINRRSWRKIPSRKVRKNNDHPRRLKSYSPSQ